MSHFGSRNLRSGPISPICHLPAVLYCFGPNASFRAWYNQSTSHDRKKVRMTWKRVRHHQLDHKIMADEHGRIYNATTCREPKQIDKNGYKMVILQVCGKPKMIGVHRLVCDAFHGAPPSPKYQPDHINGDRADNRPINLEWVTPKENVRRARSRPVRAVAANGAILQLPCLAMAADLGFNVNAISKVLHRNSTRRSQGFVWEWV